MVDKRLTMIGRLRMLPEIFDINLAAERMGCSRKDVVTYCARWKKAGLVEPFFDGRRLGIYLNRLENTNARNANADKALRFISPGPFLIAGKSALNMAGWTSQSFRPLELAVPALRGHPLPPPIRTANLLPRYRRWFGKLLAASSEAYELGDADFRLLPPEMAIADAMLSVHRRLGVNAHGPGAWTGFVGDIDQDVLDDAIGQIKECLVTLGASDEEMPGILAKLSLDHAGSALKR